MTPPLFSGLGPSFCCLFRCVLNHFCEAFRNVHGVSAIHLNSNRLLPESKASLSMTLQSVDEIVLINRVSHYSDESRGEALRQVLPFNN